MYTKILILTFFVCIGISPIHSKTITKGDINDLLTQIDQIIDEGEKYQHRLNRDRRTAGHYLGTFRKNRKT